MENKTSRREFLIQIGKLGLVASATSFFALGAATVVSLFPPPRTLRRFFPAKEAHIRQAQWWRTVCAGVQCTLCPFYCFLPEGMRGICRVRMNMGGQLVTLVYGQPVSVHVDPIEKKPVYHMLPGSEIFSISTVGCNLRCHFCQNWEISQAYPEQAKGTLLGPQEVVAEAIRSGCKSIAYTYGEPVVFYEYVLDTAKLAKKKGLRNVLVSGGYITPEPLRELARFFDVIKIDLKGFNEKFYRQVVGGELRFVLNTLLELKKTGVLTEVVNLVVPALNDNMNEIKRMCEWIYTNLGPDTPLFFSRFMPQYKLTNLPPTPIETLEEARETALKTGLHYVYLGNMPGHPGENTYCPQCKRIIIQRRGYAVLDYHLRGTQCAFCGKHIPGIWV